jgi:membrane protein DedA with SNARE-associated domain
VEDLLVRFGPVAILVGAALEGDATLILAGVAAHLGLVGLPMALAAGCTGALLGDCVWYAVGRTAAGRIRRAAFYARVQHVVERLATRVGPAQIVLAHLVYGTRIASMVFWGMRGLPFLRFATIDLIGCAVWCGILVPLGFLLSGSATALIGEVEVVERRFAGALLAVAAAAVVGRLVVRKRLWRGRRS